MQMLSYMARWVPRIFLAEIGSPTTVRTMSFDLFPGRSFRAGDCARGWRSAFSLCRTGTSSRSAGAANIRDASQTYRDADGRPFVHTYFYPAEQYDRSLIARLAEHCREGWGEIEIHLHHGVAAPDTAENTRRQLIEFRDRLAIEHGCLAYSSDSARRYGLCAWQTRIGQLESWLGVWRR